MICIRWPGTVSHADINCAEPAKLRVVHACAIFKHKHNTRDDHSDCSAMGEELGAVKSRNAALRRGRKTACHGGQAQRSVPEGADVQPPSGTLRQALLGAS